MRLDRLDAFLQSCIDDRRAPWCDCSVWRDHREIHRFSAGVTNIDTKTPVTRKEIIPLWSSSKPITCAVALTLFEQGRFLLSDPVSKYLPEYGDLKVKRTNPDGSITVEPAKNELKMVHLFTMTGGLNYDVQTAAVNEVIRRTNGRAPTREIVRAYAEEPLEFEPGTGWKYSLCHDVLAAVVEIIAGMPMRDYAKKVIFDPLEMHDTCYGYSQNPEKYSRISCSYRRNSETRAFEEQENHCSHILGSEYDSGGAGITASVDDYMRFTDAMACGGVGANGARILSRATIDLMRTDFTTPELCGSGENRWNGFAGYGYGLGVRTHIDSSRSGLLSSYGEFGWGGAALTFLLIDPAKRLSLFLGQDIFAGDDYSREIRNILYAALDD